MSTSLPNTWGPEAGVANSDYVLEMQGDNGASQNPIQDLAGHGIGTESQESQEILSNVVRKWVRGRLRTISRVVAPMIFFSRTYPVAMNSDLWNPIMRAALSPGCKKDFFLRYVCPPDDVYNHVKILENGTLDPISPVEDVVAAKGDRAVLTHQSNITAEDLRIQFNLVTDLVRTEAGAIVLNGISFIGEECPSCNNSDGQALIAVGGDAIAAPAVTLTPDRFETVTTPSVGSALDVSYAVMNSGSLILQSYGDDADPTAATTAFISKSIDGGTTWIDDATIDDVIVQFIEVGKDLLAIGYTVTVGLPVIWLSNDRAGTWVEITDVLLAGTDRLLSGAYDHIRGKLYFCGEASIFWTGSLTTNGITLYDISANLPGAPATLNEVLVLDTDNVLVAGAAGYLAESWDGGVTISTILFPTVDEILTMDGDKYRVVLGAGTNAYLRDILSKNEISVLVLEGGVTLTGNVTDVSMNVYDDFERFALVTDTGEIALGLPPYPGA